MTSHRSEITDGTMFPTEVDFKGRPIDAAWAEARLRNKRLQEIQQMHYPLLGEPGCQGRRSS